MSYLEQLEAHLGARYSKHTRRNFLRYAQHFLDVIGEKPSYSREEVLAYLDNLIRAGYRAGSIHTNMSGVRALFDTCNLTWPLTSRDMRLGLPQQEPDAPALAPEEVVALIGGVRDRIGFARTVVAYATIYGLRGDEIARAIGAGCDGRRLKVQTAKGGRSREHVIPLPLRSALTHRAAAVSTRRLHDLFEEVMKAHVREPRPREGWHSLRRSVVTGLLSAGVETYKVHHWMGWKLQEDIATRYYKPDPLKLDREIYLAHPFVRAWLPPVKPSALPPLGPG